MATNSHASTYTTTIAEVPEKYGKSELRDVHLMHAEDCIPHSADEFDDLLY